jgi:hypothetical protein
VLIVNKRNHKPTPADVYVGRPTVLGNPFSHEAGTLAKHRVATREEAVSKYHRWLANILAAEAECFEPGEDRLMTNAIRALKPDSVLVCWCAPQRCHAEIIVRAWKWLQTQP